MTEHQKQRFPCYCCGYLTRAEESPGTFEICPVCGWEDDNVQCNDESYEGGANGISLQQARRNYKQFGAVSPSIAERVRMALPDEYPK
jgi:hypothetical protein